MFIYEEADAPSYSPSIIEGKTKRGQGQLERTTLAGATKIKKVIINSDGACWGNPGAGAIGAVVKDTQGRVIASISEAIGQTTNNQAEYRAVIAGLETAIRLGASHVELRSDSELLVRQISGDYRVKNVALKPLYERAKQLQSRFQGFSIIHIPDEENFIAHNLASKALKNHQIPQS